MENGVLSVSGGHVLSNDGVVDEQRNTILARISVLEHPHRGAVSRRHNRNRRRVPDSGRMASVYVSNQWDFA